MLSVYLSGVLLLSTWLFLLTTSFCGPRQLTLCFVPLAHFVDRAPSLPYIRLPHASGVVPHDTRHAPHQPRHIGAPSVGQRFVSSVPAVAGSPEAGESGYDTAGMAEGRRGEGGGFEAQVTSWRMLQCGGHVMRQSYDALPLPSFAAADSCR